MKCKNILPKFISSILPFVFLLPHLWGQELTSKNQLHVGDKMPSYILKDVLNDKTTTISSDDLKEKFIIIDFWSHGCSGCIRSFPLMDSMQIKYKDKIQILMVCKETKDSTLHFLAKHPKIKMLSLPFVTGDSLLMDYFPHFLYPHEVWIDPNGIIKAVTDGTARLKEMDTTILKFISGDSLNLNVKRDYRTDFHLPKMVSDYVNNNLKFEYYFYLAPYDQAYSSDNLDGRATYPDGSYKRIISGGISIKNLYKYAYGKLPDYAEIHFGDNRIIFNCDNPDKYNFNHTDKTGNNLYRLDLIINKPIPKDRFKKFFRNQLDFILGFESKIEERETDCWILKRNSSYSGKIDLRRIFRTLDIYTSMLREDYPSIIDETNLSIAKNQVLPTKNPFIKNEEGENAMKTLAECGVILMKGKRKMENIVLTPL